MRTRKRISAKQEKFAQLVAQGMGTSKAYAEAGYAATGELAADNGYKLLNKPFMAARVAEIREMANGLEVTLMTILEKRIFLAEVIRTPIGSIGPDSRLCQEFYEKVNLPPEGEEGKIIVRRRRVKMVDKLRAIEVDSKLANHFAAAKGGDAGKAATDAHAVEAKAAELIRGIADRVRTVLPVIGEDSFARGGGGAAAAVAVRGGCGAGAGNQG